MQTSLNVRTKHNLRFSSVNHLTRKRALLPKNPEISLALLGKALRKTRLLFVKNRWEITGLLAHTERPLVLHLPLP